MPVHLEGAFRKVNAENLANIKEDMGYKYPEGLDLRPGSKLHTDIVEMVLERADESAKLMNVRHDSWNQISRSLSAYIRPDDEDDWVEKLDVFIEGAVSRGTTTL